MMLSKILGLRTTIYRVGDLNVAKQWYSQVFQTAPYFDEAFYVGFNIAGYELGLQLEEKLTTNKPDSVETYWGVEDIQAEYKRFLSLGAIEYDKPREVGEGIMVAKVKDPWGNVIGLIYNPHFAL